MFNFEVSVLAHISLSMSPLHWDGAPPQSHNLGHQEETKNWGLLISDRAVYLNKSLLRSNFCLEPHLSLLRSLLPIRAGPHLPENLRGFLTASTKLGQTYLIFYVGVSLKVVLITQKYTFMFCNQHKTKDRAQLCDIKMYWIKNIMVKSPSGCMNKIENVQNMSQKINWCYLSRKLCSPHCRCISSARALFMWRLAVILLLPMFCGPPAGPVPSNWPRCMGRGKGEMEGVCYV